jgi:hypothetical protein
MSKNKAGRQKKRTAPAPDAGRRKFIIIGLGALAAGVPAVAVLKSSSSSPAPVAQKPLPPAATPAMTATPAASATARGGLAPMSLPATAENARFAAEEIITYYARELDHPSALIHAVRGMGRDFALADGTNAVAHLCAKFAAEKEISGKRYVYFPRSVEVHDDSFLKTFLEAGVSPEQPISAGGKSYTLRDLGESAKAIFRCDPYDLARYEPTFLHEHLPWHLIAFSILVPPAQAAWTNAYGEVINLPTVIDRGLAAYESTCASLQSASASGASQPAAFREEIKKYSCFGLHSVYSFFSCLKHGYRGDNLPARARQMLDLVMYRLQSDPEAIDREYAAAAQQPLPPAEVTKLSNVGLTLAQITEAFRVRAQVKFFGHAFEAINYGLLHRLFTLSAEQKQRAQAGERQLHENIVKLRALDLEALKRWNRQFVSDTVVALGHAARALKLLTPRNPDTLAKK